MATTGSVLSLAEQQVGPETEFHGHLGQRRSVHHALAKIGQCTFGEVVEPCVDDVGHHPAQYGIAEELEAFVARRSRCLGDP